ncbi:hypothetical protein [Archaeoglobus sp.]
MREIDYSRYWWIRERMRDGWKCVEEFLEIVSYVNSSSKFEEYLKRLEKAKKTWLELEPKLPLITPKDVKKIVMFNVGNINFDRCIEIAETFAAYPKPIRYFSLEEELRGSQGFGNLRENSVRKVLLRYLRYMVEGGFIVKTCFRTKKGSCIHALYFRLFRMVTENDDEYERGKKLLDELKKIIVAFEKKKQKKY